MMTYNKILQTGLVPLSGQQITRLWLSKHYLIDAFGSSEAGEQDGALHLCLPGDGVSRDEGVSPEVDVEVENARVRLRLLVVGQRQRLVTVELRVLQRRRH